MAHKVLVVDDERSIVRLVCYNLEKEGFITLKAYDGEEALEVIRRENPDLVVLDVMLPRVDGFEVCRRVRREGIPVAIIMLTAKDQEIDTVVGLELGADDYMTKPFSPRELVARIKAVLRRTSTVKDRRHGGIIKSGGLVIDPVRHEVTVDGRAVELTPKEFELLYFLAQNPGQVMSRDTLLDRVWGYAYDGDTRVVDVHVSHLREKIEVNPKNPTYIKTVWGVGYKFQGPGK